MAGIEFAPPMTGNLQGFNVAPPPNPDPLATLAQMSQLRTQGLQQQEAQLGLQQKSMDIQSERGFLKAYLEANGDPEQAIKLAPGYGVLPKDIFNAQKMIMDWQTAKANLSKIDLENTLTHNDMLHNLMQPMFDEKNENKQAALAAQLNQEALNRGLVTPETQFQYNGPESARLYEAGLNTEKYTTTQAQAQQAKAEAAAKGTEVAGQQKTQAIADVQAKRDLESGLVSPADWAAIKDKYPNVMFPSGIPTAARIDEFIRSGVPPKEQPGYDVENLQRELYRTMTAVPGAIEQKVKDAGITPEGNPILYQATVADARRQGTYKGIDEAIRRGQDKITPYDPGVIAGGAKEAAVKTGATTSAGAAANVANLPYPWNQPGGDPETRRKGMTDEYAVNKQYGDKMTATQHTIDTINAALHGNQKAANFATIEQLKSQLNRVTNTEIAASEAGGSYIRRLQNDISQNFKGRPYSDTLRDSLALADLEKKAAYREMKFGKQSLSQIHGVGQLQDAPLPPGVAPAPKQIVVNAGGKLRFFDSEADAKRFEDLVKKGGGASSRQ